MKFYEPVDASSTNPIHNNYITLEIMYTVSCTSIIIARVNVFFIRQFKKISPTRRTYRRDNAFVLYAYPAQLRLTHSRVVVLIHRNDQYNFFVAHTRVTISDNKAILLLFNISATRRGGNLTGGRATINGLLRLGFRSLTTTTIV